MRIGASKLLNSTKRRTTECDRKCGLFSPNSGVVRPVMHSRIKFPATRERAPPRRGKRRATLIAKVIKPINAVLCAACHCVQEIAPLISACLFLRISPRETDNICKYRQHLWRDTLRLLLLSLLLLVLKQIFFSFFDQEVK